MKILFPTDFSEKSYNALKYTIELANSLNSEVVLLHTIITIEVPFIAEEERETENLKKAKIAEEEVKKCEAFINNQAPQLKISTIIEEGSAIERIGEISETENIDIIVMATEGSDGVKEFIFGSNTGKVLGNTKIPLLVVPDEAIYKGINHISFASRLFDEDLEYFREVAVFARLLSSRLSIINIRKEKTHTDYSEFEQAVRQEFSEVEIKSIQSENVAEALETEMKASGSDLLVLMKRKKNIFVRMFGENLSRDLTFHAHFPLLIFPR